ncbi:HNH endonuclease [Micromonospora sp. D93]|uniref:HNH endonuclease n=1 Tax=Micromonospora sp. D93 TaxID=2824886 RepID=UPI001B390CF4|nr:HNH endonuclease [Micromonospora sp. D93]MBQ1021754.1 HNH endonuclease [Micromonospora sp. D93]
MPDTPSGDPLSGFSPARPYTRDAAGDAPRTSGVHVVGENGVVVYVGSTRDLGRRLRQHLTGNRGSSVLHDQVGRLLDQRGAPAAAADIADWLGHCDLRWLRTDDAQGVKEALVAALGPRFNRHVPKESGLTEVSAKQRQFDRLKSSRYYGGVLDAVRAYLRVAVPDAADKEREYWALSCMPATFAGRFAAVSMKRMETFVLAEPAEPNKHSLITGFVIVRWSALRQHWPTFQAFTDAFPDLTIHHSDYADPGPDQARVDGWHHHLMTAFRDDRFAAAVRDLTEPLLKVRTLHAAGHNDQLAEQVLKVDNLANFPDDSRAIEPEAASEGRRRRLAEVTARQGQADFRRRLMKAYGNRCAITGCDTEAALQAAHIDPYDGPGTNQVNNGLLLRADLHNLLDRGLIWIDESYVLHVVAGIAHYSSYHGQRMRLPERAEDLPDPEALLRHRRAWHGFHDVVEGHEPDPGRRTAGSSSP